MIITVDCSCGARLEIEDASEVAGREFFDAWMTLHGGHRRTLEEYAAELEARWRPLQVAAS